MQTVKIYIKEDILNPAIPLFYAKGYSKVPMREIAETGHVFRDII